jgi:flagellin
MSLLAIRVLNQNQKKLNTSIERLSTGLAINSAADDPSGLIASEMLRSQKVSLSAAINNCENASYMIATAEGALNEVSSLLVDLNGLVVSTANSAALSDDEIEANQLMVDSILESINRLAAGTEYKGKKLFNGSLGYYASGVAASAITDVNIDSASLGSTSAMNVYVTTDPATTPAEVTINGESAAVDGSTVAIDSSNLSLNMTLSDEMIHNGGTTSFTIGGGATFCIGANVEDGMTSVSFGSIYTCDLGNSSVGYLDSLASGKDNNLSSNNLSQAQSIVESSINQVASMRARLGAFQTYTLDTTVNSLSVALENTTMAESSIRDTDFAKETSNMVRAQILVQSTMSVLKQIISAPKIVLDLLN